MPQQLSFAGFETAPQPTDRLFFAIFPDADAAARIARLARHLRGEHALRGRPLTTERFHITLHHLGDYAGLPQDVVGAAAEAATTVATPEFNVVFDRVLSFSGRPGNRPFVLRGGDGLVALSAFQQTLGWALRKAGLGRWVAPPFTPHVTLLYDDISVAERSIEPLDWTVREFALVHSLLGRTRHIPLARWPLQKR